MLYYGNRSLTATNTNTSAPASSSSNSSSIPKSASHQLNGGPIDGISHITWSNDASTNLLSCGSWDSSVRVWQISESFGGTVNSQPKCLFNLQQPVLTSCFSPDSTKLFAGGCDKMVKMFDINHSNQSPMQIAQHDQPVCKAAWCQPLNVLVTASWDGNVRMWDGKSANPVWQYNTGKKIYAMDVKSTMIAVADSARQIYVWNTNNLSNCCNMISPLKMMTRSICLFSDLNGTNSTVNNMNSGVIIGSIEGRCSVMYLEDKTLDFSFRCHRVDSKVFALNAIDFHRSGAFSTCGGDGTICIWHKNQRQKLRTFTSMGSSVVDCRFHPSGNNLFAYALSYDWHKGLEQSEIQQSPNTVHVHLLKEDDLKARPKTTNARR